MATQSFTPNYSDTSWKTKAPAQLTIQDIMNAGYTVDQALQLIGGPNHDNGANYVAYTGDLTSAAKLFGYTPNTSGTPPTITADTLKSSGWNPSTISGILGTPVDTNRPYHIDANGNPVYEDTGAKSTPNQSGASQTQTYTLNGQTFTTAPGGSIPVGGSKVSDSTGTYTPVNQPTAPTTTQASNTFTNPYTGITYNTQTGAIISDPNNAAASIGQGGTATTPTAADQSGIASINQTLNLGSQGDQVKALQQYLNGLGYLGTDGKPLKIDGIYGPQTQAAVVNFQSHNGLTADGIFGPKSLAKTNQITATDTSAGNSSGTPSSSGTSNTTGGNSSTPSTSGNTVTFGGQTYTTSSPEEAALLNNAILPFLDQMQKSGMIINPDLNLGPDVIAKILEKAKATVHPQYAQQIAGVQQDLARNVGNSVDAYGNAVEGSKQNFLTDLSNSRENNAGAGLAFSGSRNLGEQNLADTENRSLSSLSSQYGSNIGDYARNAEKSLGTAGMNGYQLPSLASYSANLSGNGSLDTSGNVNTGYTPGTYQLGTIPQSETAAALALRNQNVDQASSLKSAGLDYSSLYA